MYNVFGTVNISHSTVSGNLAGRGGGVYNRFNGTVYITNSTVRKNTAGDDGGGVFNDGGTVTLTNVDFKNNKPKGTDCVDTGGGTGCP